MSAKVTVRERLASVCAVLFGPYGAVIRQAREQERSRQGIYREASAVEAELAGEAGRRRVRELEEEVARLEAEKETLGKRLDQSVEVDADKQAEFISTAQAEGVSLPVGRRLLVVLLGKQTPSVSELQRHSGAAAARAGEVLAELDAAARSQAKTVVADEIFLDGDRC